MKTYFVVTAILQNPEGKILLLKKQEKDHNYPGKWSFCSGFIKEYEAAEDTVLREIKEETGLDATITKNGNIIEVEDTENQKKWVIACFLGSVNSEEITLCHENTEYRWVLPSEVEQFDTVPGLVKDLKVMGLVE